MDIFDRKRSSSNIKISSAKLKLFKAVGDLITQAKE